MTTPDEANAVELLTKLAAELQDRLGDIGTFDAAYRGEHSLYFASEDFRQYFADRYKDFADNWCAVVAEAPHERLEPTGIRLEGETNGDDGLWDDWRTNDADAYADLAILDAIKSKRAFGLVWGDADGEPRITFEHPSQAIVGYDPETRERIAGAKIWRDDRFEYATLYTPDQVWKFQRENVNRGVTRSGLIVPGNIGGWQKRQPSTDDTWPLPNPLRKVPLVELPNRPQLLGEPLSDIAGALSMQRAINLIWSQLFLATDNASWPQKVVMGAERPTIPVLDEDGQPIGERPIDLKKFAVDRVQWIEDPKAKIGEWSAANLEAYTKIIDKAVAHLAAQTRTPATYFLLGGTVANLSADAIKALETGLVKRTEEKTQHFGRGIRDLFELVALVRGDDAKASAVRRGKVLWKDVENRSDAQVADALQKKKDIGYPLRYLLELDGLNPPEIDRVMQMARDEANDPLTQHLLRGAGLGGTPGATADADLGE